MQAANAKKELEWVTLDRIRYFEVQIENIKSSEFIRTGTIRAIDSISESISNLKKEIMTAAKIDNDNYLIQRSISVNQKIFQLTRYLGNLLRSTKTRNCFEAYYALEAMVERLIGHKNTLIISSEWDASPFYIEGPPDALDEFVFIGFPAFASRNALLLPLAAHEIGHAVWRRYKLDSIVYTDAAAKLVAYIKETNILSDSDDRTLFFDQDREDFIKDVLTLLLDQCQEVFCDLFGALLFKKSYSYAFEQYLSPGFGWRDASYPSFEDRISYIRKVAFADFPEDEPHCLQFSAPTNPKNSPKELKAADAVLEQMKNILKAKAKEILAQSSLLDYSKEDEKSVFKCLKSQIPPNKPFSAVCVLNATWKMYLEKIEVEHDFEKRQSITEFTNNICIKSLELLEYSNIRK